MLVHVISPLQYTSNVIGRLRLSITKSPCGRLPIPGSAYTTMTLFAVLGQWAITESQTASIAAGQLGSKWKNGIFSLNNAHTFATSLSSISFCESNSQITFSMSFGAGSVAFCILGHFAITESQTPSTTVWQSGLKWKKGAFSAINAQTFVVSRSSISFCEAILHRSFSMSSIGAAAATGFGHFFTIVSHSLSTAATQTSSGTAGNFLTMSLHTSPEALSSICFFEASSHTNFSRSLMLGIPFSVRSFLGFGQ